MIHIIVYSTTNTVAKMYKKKKKPFQNNRRKMIMAGTLVIHLKGCGRANPTHCVVCAYGGL